MDVLYRKGICTSVSYIFPFGICFNAEVIISGIDQKFMTTNIG